MKKLFPCLFAIAAVVILFITSCKKDIVNSTYSGTYIGLLADTGTLGTVTDTIIISDGSASGTIQILDENTGATIVANISANVNSGSGTTAASLTITNQLITVGTTTMSYSGTGTLVTTTGQGTTLAFTLTSMGGTTFTFNGKEYSPGISGSSGPTEFNGNYWGKLTDSISTATGGVDDTVIVSGNSNALIITVKDNGSVIKGILGTSNGNTTPIIITSAQIKQGTSTATYSGNASFGIDTSYGGHLTHLYISLNDASSSSFTFSGTLL